eukprot:CAMPEP_0185042056 /NCGR_PEP_ID=MMETSP1103-20130426/42115_1 /TAXON_ID=36769 /ORGANISM="Paraphysomonas bandaiensis, Strain Caron Lab Isolate" /LENGTH=535 /DNA_ID=CAMNT_0027582055 /DNA_START=221 /DNA_END=1828 /DNA_ORIENTATION=+
MDDYTKKALQGLSDVIKRKDVEKIPKNESTDSGEDVDISVGKSKTARVTEFLSLVQSAVFDSSAKEDLETTQGKAESKKQTKALKADMFSIIPSSVLDEKTKNSLREVSKLGERLASQYEKSTVDLQHPFLVNLGLLRLYTDRDSSGDISSSPSLLNSSTSSVSEEFLAEAKYYLRYAADVYMEAPYIVQEDIILNELEEHSKVGTNVKLPRHVVFLDHLTKSIVVSIRGTGSISDVLTDLNLNAIPFLSSSDTLNRGLFKRVFEKASQIVCSPSEVKAHSGMAASANALFDPVQCAIAEARSRKNGRYAEYKVVVTGHSLGAGTACLLAMLLSSRANMAVTTFAYAPPPVITTPPETFSILHDAPLVSGKHPDCVIHSFVHNKDVVPRASHYEFVNMLSAVKRIDGLPWSATERAMILVRNRLMDDERETLKERLTGLEAREDAEDMHSEDRGVELIVPGNVYLLSPLTESDMDPKAQDGKKKAAQKKYSIRRVDDSRMLFSGFLFTGDSMVLDHPVAGYLNSILNISTDERSK